MPSPSSDMRFCTRNTPISGAHAPTTSPATSASCMYVASNGHGSGHGMPGTRHLELLEPERAGRRGARRGSRRSPRGRSAARRTAPALQHDDAVEVVGDRAELVRDEQHGGAVLAHEVHERVAEQPLRLRVDARDRLVEHEQLGLAGERLRDQHALLLPARQLDDRASRAGRRAPTDSRRGRPRPVGRPRAGATSPRRAAGRRRRPPRPSPAGRARGRRRCGTYPSRPAVAERARVGAEQLDRPASRRRAARAACAAASTSPSRSGRPARRTRRRRARSVHVLDDDGRGAVVEGDVVAAARRVGGGLTIGAIRIEYDRSHSVLITIPAGPRSGGRGMAAARRAPRRSALGCGTRAGADRPAARRRGLLPARGGGPGGRRAARRGRRPHAARGRAARPRAHHRRHRRDPRRRLAS